MPLNPFVIKITLDRFLSETPPREQYRLGLLWSVVILALIILGFTSYHVQAIPKSIERNIYEVLEPRSWIRDFVVVDGRHIYLRGEVEPDSGLETEISRIADVPGVAHITNVLDEIPKPSLHLQLKKLDNELLVNGKVSGPFLEPIISYVESSFPDHPVKDRLIIDDRLGRPLWFEGFDQSLSQLNVLDNFEIHAWRDQIEITGFVENDLQRRQIGYAIPASLIGHVKVVNRLKQKTAEAFTEISLVSDWRGISITGVVPSVKIRQKILTAARNAFGVGNIDSDLTIKENLLGRNQLLVLIELLPYLAQVQDLRLESAAKGFVVWGRFDTPLQLGQFLHARNRLGLEETLQNQILIAKAGKSASITLFSDQTRAIINGVLPTMKAKQQVILEITETLGIDEIVDLVSIEPNVAHSKWLTKWPDLLANLPRTVIGITLDEKALLITGFTQTESQLTQIEQRLSILFPDQNRLNWITAINP